MRSRPHWSYSQVAQYLRCPLQYYFERILKLPKSSVGTSLALGSAVHAALADYHRQLQADQTPLADRLHQTFRQAWDGIETEKSLQYRPGEVRNDLIDKGIALVELYVSQPPPANIVAIEEELMVPIFNSRGELLEKPLLAVVDLMTRESNGLLVRDFKTSSRKYGEADAATALQVTCYVHAVREKYDEVPEFRYTVLVKTKTPQIQELPAEREHADIGRLGDLIQVVEHAVAANIFYPVESPLNCSSCPFRQVCREWQGNVSVEQRSSDVSIEKELLHAH